MTAQVIVDEIGNEIHTHINFMDANGYIIASTDQARIGMLHEGAQKVIREHLEHLYVTVDMETATMKAGVNLPIVIHETIVGVIGITGEVERVIGYGKIVQHMTQIMVEDGLIKDEHRYDRRVRYRFLEEWIAGMGNKYNWEFVERGEKLGIDVRKPRRVMIIHIDTYHQLSTSLEGQEKLEQIETTIRHIIERENEGLYLRLPPKQIVLVPACSDTKIKQLAQKLKTRIYSRYEEILLIGIDSLSKDESIIFKRCNEAEKAVACAATVVREIVFYDELCMDLFMNEITLSSMEEYIRRLFPRQSGEAIEEYMQLIETYFAYEGSITKAANALYIHKNTLQYKLKKMEAITGKDIRIPTGAATYYIAKEFYQKLLKKGRVTHL